MKDTAGIGSTNPDGTLVITDTRWDGNGSLFVTVRERIGVREIDANMKERMRRLARSALMYPEQTKVTLFMRGWYSGGCSHATFRVCRVDPR